jgi:hypothetical protein
MKSLGLGRYALSRCAAAALLAGCGGSQPPIALSDAVGLAQRSRSSQHNSRGSWMLPEAKTEDLMYVSDGTLSAVLVFAYKSRKQVGQLTAFNEPYGQCVDAKGDVWITDVRNGTVAEYAHGGTKPLKTLTANQGGGPVGCSVSPDGDLAVSVDNNLGDSILHGSSIGGVFVFKDASGTPSIYASNDCYAPASPGYDLDGNLYVEGIHYVATSVVHTKVCELTAGGTSLHPVLVYRYHRDPRVISNAGAPGSVMWDGKHITVTNALDARLFVTDELSDGNLRVRSVTDLRYSGCTGDVEPDQLFLVGKVNTPVNHEEATTALGGTDIGVGSCYQYFNGWAYPRGGNPEWTMALRYPFGESVSLVPR